MVFNYIRNKIFVCFGIFLFLILGACTSLKTLDSIDPDVTNLKIFDQDFEKALYKSTMKYKGNTLSGLMLIKYLPVSQSYRVVFMSEVGFNYFDYEFLNSEKNNFKIHYSVSYLNNNAFIKKIKRDLESLFLNYPASVEKSYFLDEKDGIMLTRYQGIGVNSYYSRKVKEDLFMKIEIKGMFYTKSQIEILEYLGSGPSKIHIIHKPKSLKIDLLRIVNY